MWEHQGWGNIIEWAWGQDRKNFDVMDCAGCLRNRPKVGDKLIARKKDNSEHEFEFTEVELRTNPPDAFFGTVKYVREISMNEAA